MARIRTIKPDFWTDEKVVELSPLARLLFIGLWNFADDEGRMPFSQTRIKLQILPADSADITALLGEIRGKSLIDVYIVDAQEYLQINNFAKHQKIDKRTASKLPEKGKVSPVPAEVPRVPPTEVEVEVEGKGNNTGVGPALPETREPSNPQAGAMAAELRRKGVTVTSQHPTLLQWLADGFSIPSALEAVEIARLSKPIPEPLPANYVDRILRNPPKKAEPAWWSSDNRIIAKGKELDLNPRPGEEMVTFKERIQNEIGKRKQAA